MSSFVLICFIGMEARLQSAYDTVLGCAGGSVGWGTSVGGSVGWGTSVGGSVGWGTSVGGVVGWGTSVGGSVGWGTSVGGVVGWGTSVGGSVGRGVRVGLGVRVGGTGVSVGGTGVCVGSGVLVGGGGSVLVVLGCVMRVALATGVALPRGVAVPPTARVEVGTGLCPGTVVVVGRRPPPPDDVVGSVWPDVPGVLVLPPPPLIGELGLLGLAFVGAVGWPGIRVPARVALGISWGRSTVGSTTSWAASLPAFASAAIYAVAVGSSAASVGSSNNELRKLPRCESEASSAGSSTSPPEFPERPLSNGTYPPEARIAILGVTRFKRPMVINTTNVQIPTITAIRCFLCST
jgi:hypothetical protein